MADQHHESVPTSSNTIKADLSDISEALSYHWDCIQVLLGVPDLTTIANVSPPGPQRSTFSHVDDDTITIGPGVYFHDGTARQTVFWDADITFECFRPGTGGSNADNSAAGASEWHYIYLDDSAIVTQASPELDADCFLNSTTAPTWSDAKHGWYNGSDRCIFAILTDGTSDIVEFYHDGGDAVFYADNQTERSVSALDSASSWVDVDMKTSVPGFSTKAQVNF